MAALFSLKKTAVVHGAVDLLLKEEPKGIEKRARCPSYISAMPTFYAVLCHSIEQVNSE